MMITVPFALYDAFSETAFGGSQAGIVSDAGWLNAETRQKIAKEIGVPATGFVTAHNENSISARFHSTVTEYPMCGHGTIGLMTRMVELGLLNWKGNDRINVELCLPTATTSVEIFRGDNGQPTVFLDINSPSFRQDRLDAGYLTALLGLRKQDCSEQWPVEIASGDFVHLVVPLKNLETMRRITPDFAGLIRFCHEIGVQTVAVFCTETERPDSTLHVRDFCPAVGVLESAAAGTTNCALSSYLVRHGLVQGSQQIRIQAEQGHEIGRPSIIRSVISMSGGCITRLQIGGVATKVMDGKLFLPTHFGSG